MKLRVLIVDDEALARTRVRKMLAEEAEVEVLGECANGPEAIAAIRQHRPDLVFLDVQMPEVSGFDVLRALAPDEIPAVIFVTAHDEHAIEAFEVHALDYLLKPFKQSRFQEALQRAREHLASRDVRALNQRLTDWLNAPKAESPCLTRLAVKSGERTVFIKVEDVDYIESAGNYAILHVGKESHILRETLTNLEAKLSPRLFLRVNRSALVNLTRVKELQPALRGDHVVILKDGKQLALTRGVREIQERLQYS
jgi:two-component system LytT family response regulator